ncbi:hypothetical protein [Alienimonas californiensis]|uniref:Bacterial Ig-like domain-containing protein n=1 Tax=Alienimonas californiensis TaxID=2527989 RepID=A0A517PFN3_9PLAN|nr:hypothetical protein [Alienimonas californiensis]QDT18171.1 hypothetical protein CA12_43120 [Alienimonas californiensis]
MGNRIERLCRVRVLLTAAACCVAAVARADLGPENVVLVVNGDSLASRTAANHYIAARGLANVAVVTLHDLPDWEATDVGTFRDRILTPVLTGANDRGLAPQLDAIAYSTAIPTKIRLSEDLTAEVLGESPAPHKIFTPYGSLTGLTTLYEPVLQKRAAEYLAPNANAAFAGPERDAEGTVVAPATVGFRRALGFGADRKPTIGPGRRYLLSTVLGVTTGRGETLEEVVDRLRTAAAADGTRPAGAVIFCETKDVRSTTRQPQFAAAVAGIEAEAAARGLDVRAEIVTTALPRRERALVGLTAGLPGVKPMDWTIADVGFAPGAFADNLTSWGAVLSERAHGQVTAVDWLRFGAAASGGTVHEPYAVPFKFPSPFVHLHRLRGLTLAEAVLRSVSGPYQYLTVGDPLSNPYARRPIVTLGMPESSREEPLSGVVPITLGAADGEGNPVPLAGWELYVDGKRIAVLPPGQPFNWDTTDLPDGAHQFAAVAVAADPAQSRGRAVRGAFTRNAAERVILELAPGTTEATWGEPLSVPVVTRGDRHGRAAFFHGSDELAELPGSQFSASGPEVARQTTAWLDTRPLGLGPVTLRAEATPAGDDGEPGTPVRAAPLHLTIVPPPNRVATVAEEVELLDGPALRWADGEPVPLANGLPAGWLAKAGAPAEANFTLTAVVTATETGLHCLALKTNCGVTIAVDGEPAPAMMEPSEASAAAKAWRCVPVWLEPGRHTFVLTGRTPEKGPVLDVQWGRRGLQTATAERWQRVAQSDAD